MGYDVRDRQLVVNETDATTVQSIFALYLEVGNVPAVLDRLEAENIRTAKRYSAKGKHYGERPFTRGHLYKLLTNPIYIGRIPHKTASHPGQHQKIIDAPLWDAVQARLAANTQGTRARRSRARQDAGLLSGVLVTASGNGFVSSHANKGSRRYRYYVEQHAEADRAAVRLPAADIENAVACAVAEFLTDRGTLLSNFADLDRSDLKPVLLRATALAEQIVATKGMKGRDLLRPLLAKVVYRQDALTVELRASALRQSLGLGEATTADDPRANYRAEDAPNVVLNSPLTARRRGRQLKLILGEEHRQSRPDATLITAISRAHRWAEELVTGASTSISQIAEREGMSLTYVAQLVPFGFLAPSITTDILAGRQPADLTADRLIRRAKVPPRWAEQN